VTQAVADHLWQSTLFVVVAWLLTLVLRNNAAKVRYWVWFAASMKFCIPFALLTSLGRRFSWRTSESTSLTESFATVMQQVVEPLSTPPIVPPAATYDFDYRPIVIAIWVLGCVCLLVRWSLRWLRVRSAVRMAVDIPLEAPILVKSSSGMSEPAVVGIVNPVLLLPEGIATRLRPAHMQAILAHELCHVRRRDNLTAAIHMVVEVVFWFHPLVWWIGARLIEERERACDEAVIELGNERQIYAEGILKVCQFYVESKLACVAGVSGASLRKRVEAIMSCRIASYLTVAKKTLLAGVATMLVATPLIMGLFAAPEVRAQANAATLFVEPTAADRPIARADGEERRIVPGDTVTVFVEGQPQLSRRLVVSKDGKIVMPLAKEISVHLVKEVPGRGKTEQQLARDIEDALTPYLRAPKVTVSILL
jgi:bla regulator protein blaR1